MTFKIFLNKGLLDIVKDKARKLNELVDENASIERVTHRKQNDIRSIEYKCSYLQVQAVDYVAEYERLISKEGK